MKQNGFFAEVIKTNIINVDESSHELPPHGGAYPEFKVADYYCPEEWSNDGVFIPVKEGDPLWFDFRSNDDECAILCAVQRINPVTGEPADLDEGLSKDPAQNYLRMPEQMWLDGYAKEGKVYQFVVTKAGIGLAVNEYVLPKHMQDSHAIGFAFFAPKNPKPKPILSGEHLAHYLADGGWIGSPLYGRNYGGSETFGSFGYGPNHLPSYRSRFVSASTPFGLCTGRSGPDSRTGDGAGTDRLVASDDATLCCNSFDTNKIVMGSSVDTARLTRNRVADDYVEQAEEAPEIETVDILAEPDANINKLDKASMGAGGRIHQEISIDSNTTDYYHKKRSALLTIYFALPEMYNAIMKKGKRQDSSRKDKYKTSGHIGGVAVPLIDQEID